MRGYSSANGRSTTIYTIFVNEKHRVASVTVEGPGMLRRIYPRKPEQYEIKLTATTFKEAAYWICKQDSKRFARMKEAIRDDAEYYLMLQEVLEKVYNEYKELIES